MFLKSRNTVSKTTISQITSSILCIVTTTTLFLASCTKSQPEKGATCLVSSCLAIGGALHFNNNKSVAVSSNTNTNSIDDDDKNESKNDDDKKKIKINISFDERKKSIDVAYGPCGNGKWVFCISPKEMQKKIEGELCWMNKDVLKTDPFQIKVNGEIMKNKVMLSNNHYNEYIRRYVDRNNDSAIDRLAWRIQEAIIYYLRGTLKFDPSKETLNITLIDHPTCKPSQSLPCALK